MNLLLKPALIFQAVWACISALGALFILWIMLGAAGWGGGGFEIYAILLLALCSVLGLLIGVPGSFSHLTIYMWAAGIGAFIAVCLSSWMIFGFLFKRAPEVPLNSPVSIAGMSAPLLAFYAFALIPNVFELIISAKKIHQLRTIEVTPWQQ